MKYDVSDVLWFYGCYMILYDEINLYYESHVLFSHMKNICEIIDQIESMLKYKVMKVNDPMNDLKIHVQI